MKTVPFGDTGIQVSAFCLGTMNMGSRVDPETSFRIIDEYFEAGGFFLDTANVYSHWNPNGRVGDSEELIGAWMRQRGNRSRIFLATKVGLEYPGREAGLKARAIEEECEKSLKRLGIDSIDLFYAHRDDRDTPLEESLAAFDRLVQAGKVRFVGASNYPTWRLVEARWLSRTSGQAPYSCIQQRYSYLRQNPAASFASNANAAFDMFDYCKTENIPIVGFSALAKGGIVDPDKLQDQYAGADTETRLAVLRQVAAEIGATPNQVVLAWIIHQDAPIIPLFSTSSIEQIKENLGAIHLQLSAEQMIRLNESGA